jgi:hypothetical protein
MENANRSTLFKKAAITITLSPMPDTFNLLEYHEPKIPCEIKIKKKKRSRSSLPCGQPCWKKFITLRSRFDQFSRMDSVTSSISNEDHYVSPCDDDSQISVSIKTPDLEVDDESTFKSRHKGIHQDTANNIDNQYRKDHRVSKLQKYTKEVTTEFLISFFTGFCKKVDG